MKKIFILLVAIAILAVIHLVSASNPKSPAAISPSPTNITMTLTSPSFKHNESIPSKYTCESEDVNPALRISNTPSAAKSLVLIMDDPDAPRSILPLGSGQAWVHWTIWNIDPNTKEIGEDSIPTGAIEGVTSFKRTGYGGPCPPSGTHRYFFKLYALDIMLNLPANAVKSDVESAIAGHILAQAKLIGFYKKTK